MCNVCRHLNDKRLNESGDAGLVWTGVLRRRQHQTATAGVKMCDRRNLRSFFSNDRRRRACSGPEVCSTATTACATLPILLWCVRRALNANDF